MLRTFRNLNLSRDFGGVWRSRQRFRCKYALRKSHHEVIICPEGLSCGRFWMEARRLQRAVVKRAVRRCGSALGRERIQAEARTVSSIAALRWITRWSEHRGLRRQHACDLPLVEPSITARVYASTVPGDCVICARSGAVVESEIPRTSDILCAGTQSEVLRPRLDAVRMTRRVRPLIRRRAHRSNWIRTPVVPSGVCEMPDRPAPGQPLPALRTVPLVTPCAPRLTTPPLLGRATARTREPAGSRARNHSEYSGLQREVSALCHGDRPRDAANWPPARFFREPSDL